MSPAEQPSSRTVSLDRVRRARATPAPAASEALQPFCGFAAAMAELARQSDQRRSRR
ncbi:MAG TPA: hypothetical protein VGE22_08075 [Solimonas sp.]